MSRPGFGGLTGDFWGVFAELFCIGLIWLGLWGGFVGGGVGVVFRALAEAGADGVLVDVVLAGGEVGMVLDAVIGEASLPDGKI